MKTLLKNGCILNVFTETVEKADVLICNDKIIGIGSYSDNEAEKILDVSEKIITPGLIDGHIHIESTMLLPYELANTVLPHGTVRIIADPHEIANVCGTAGIEFIRSASKNLPLHVNLMIPSCVPSNPFDESGAELQAEQISAFYGKNEVLGLAEMMDYPGVINSSEQVFEKINSALSHNLVIDGHAPLLTGKKLDAYISAGINSDHECSVLEEAVEKLKKGLWIMIREGTAARNLDALLPLFEKPYCNRCCLVTDDRHPADLISAGHIDAIIRKAIDAGKNPVTAFKMATFNTAQCFNIHFAGAVAPGYKADLLVLNSLEKVDINDVFTDGKIVVKDKKVLPFSSPEIPQNLKSAVKNSVHLAQLTENDFFIDSGTQNNRTCRVIDVIKGQLITKELHINLDFSKNNGIDCEKDILKLAVIERHKNTGHKGIGFIHGLGIKKGAIASTVSHDSHNLIVLGTNDKDMAFAANEIIKDGGGCIFVADGKVLAKMPLPVAGLMSEIKAPEIARQNKLLRQALHDSGVPLEIEPFLNLAFVSLPVIPDIKMTTLGLIDVNAQKLLPQFTELA